METSLKNRLRILSNHQKNGISVRTEERGPRLSSDRDGRIYRLPIPVLKILEIWSFHVVVVQRRQRNVQNKRDAREGLFFCLLNLLLFDAAVAVAVFVS